MFMCNICINFLYFWVESLSLPSSLPSNTIAFLVLLIQKGNELGFIILSKSTLIFPNLVFREGLYTCILSGLFLSDLSYIFSFYVGACFIILSLDFCMTSPFITNSSPRYSPIKFVHFFSVYTLYTSKIKSTCVCIPLYHQCSQAVSSTGLSSFNKALVVSTPLNATPL